MFVRQVTMKLRAASAPEFARLIDREILPLLRRQQGFRDEVTLVAAERSGAICTSFWNTKENAEAYSRTLYPEVLKALSKVVVGIPRVQTFDLSNSTFHSVLARAA